MTHICVGKLTTIGLDNGLSPGRHKAIIWTSAGIFLVGILGTNSREILIRVFFPYDMTIDCYDRNHIFGCPVFIWFIASTYASVTSHSRVPYGLFTGCFEQKSYVHSRGPHGPHAAPYEFCLPVRGLQNFNGCIISLRVPYGFWDPKQPLNSPCGDRKGPCGPHTAKPNTTPVRDFCQFWLNQFPYVSARVPHGPRTSPVGYEKHWRFPCGTRTVPVRASHGAPVESCESFDQTISVQPCQAVRGP